VTNPGYYTYSGNSVSAYTINATSGALKKVKRSPFGAGTAPSGARTAAVADPGLEARIHDRAVRAVAILASHQWDFRPNRPGGFHERALSQIVALQSEIYQLYEQLGKKIGDQ
jgi:hypothetical protein